MIWPRKQLVGPRMAHDEINSRMLELEVAKQILVELFDIRTHEVDELIRQKMETEDAYASQSGIQFMNDYTLPIVL